jgi:hypothetical protein
MHSHERVMSTSANRTGGCVALYVAAFLGAAACAGDDAAPERYRSIAESDSPREPRAPADAEPAGPICGEDKTYPGTQGGEACTIDLPASNSLVPTDLDEVNVIISFLGAERTWAIPKIKDGESCGSERAWHYDDADEPSQIILCPETCAFAMSDGDSYFQVLIGCGETCYEGDGGCDFPLI